MHTGPVRVEHRATQRFDCHLPIRIGLAGKTHEGLGLIQDLSTGGVLFYTDFLLSVGSAVELTFVMPSEITLADNMRVRCQGRVLRVIPPSVGTKSGVAVHIETFDYLPETEAQNLLVTEFSRVAALHEQPK